MKVIGITGGIGSGKSTVSKLFELLGVPVFYADDEAKYLYTKASIKAKVVRTFGVKVLSKNKQIDKRKLADLVFSNKAELAKLNAITHPAVRNQFLAWKKKQKSAKLIVKEAAIMIESGAIRDIDYLVLVKSTKELIINRLKKYRNMSISEIERRMKEQITDAGRAKYADAIILNDEKHSLIKQVIKLHTSLTKK